MPLLSAFRSPALGEAEAAQTTSALNGCLFEHPRKDGTQVEVLGLQSEWRFYGQHEDPSVESWAELPAAGACQRVQETCHGSENKVMQVYSHFIPQNFV